MKIFMVGEAANYGELLASGLSEELRPRAEIIPLPREAAHADEFNAEIAPDDVVISLRFRRTKRAPSFRLLHVPGAGTDGIDFAALADETAVCNVFEHEGPVAEFVLASMLNWEIRLDALRASFSPADWANVYRSRVFHGEVAGKIIGIIGFGRIGRAIAARAKPFGTTVIAADVARLEPGPLNDEALPVADLPRLLDRADYVIVACPLSEATRGMIGIRELDQMKADAVIINVSRAEIIDEAALYETLKAKRIRGASLDVWYRYPAGNSDRVGPSTLPFHELENAVCTPHSAAWTRVLMERRYAFIGRNLNAFASGRSLENVVRQGRQ